MTPKFTKCSRDGCENRVNLKRNEFGLCRNHSRSARVMKCRANNPEKARITAIRSTAKRYGLDPDEVVESFLEHDGKCDICGRLGGEVGKGDRLYIDHDHVRAGLFRGWLCANCNNALGLLGDDPDMIDRAAEYLRRSRRDS